jgi:hypothetical protein
MSAVDKKLAEIRERHERDAMRCMSPSIAGPQAHDDREWLLSEIERLRARVEVLEEVLHAIFPDGANINLVRKANAEEAKPCA